MRQLEREQLERDCALSRALRARLPSARPGRPATRRRPGRPASAASPADRDRRRCRCCALRRQRTPGVSRGARRRGSRRRRGRAPSSPRRSRRDGRAGATRDAARSVAMRAPSSIFSASSRAVIRSAPRPTVRMREAPWTCRRAASICGRRASVSGDRARRLRSPPASGRAPWRRRRGSCSYRPPCGTRSGRRAASSARDRRRAASGESALRADARRHGAGAARRLEREDRRARRALVRDADADARRRAGRERRRAPGGPRAANGRHCRRKASPSSAGDRQRAVLGGAAARHDDRLAGLGGPGDGGRERLAPGQRASRIAPASPLWAWIISSMTQGGPSRNSGKPGRCQLRSSLLMPAPEAAAPWRRRRGSRR